MKCKHCGQEIEGVRYPYHVGGRNPAFVRCHPKDSKLPYGYNAEPEGEECRPTCLGNKEKKQ